MSFTIEEIDKIDEAVEEILDIVDDETEWQRHNDEHNYLGEDSLDVQGRLRVRVSDVIRELIKK